MTFRRWPHGIVTLLALCLAVVILVSVETGSTVRPTAASTAHPLPGFSPTGPPAPGAGDGRGTHEHGARGNGAYGPGERGHGEQGDTRGAGVATTGEAATGGAGVVAGGGDPATRDLTTNPFNFRLGLINGTV